MESIIAIAAISLLLFTWFIYTRCAFCHSKFSFQDYASNGRVRFRKKGTEFPVCKRCALNNPEEVE